MSVNGWRLWFVCVVALVLVACVRQERGPAGAWGGRDMSEALYSSATVVDSYDGVYEYAGQGVRVVSGVLVVGDGILFTGEIIAHTSEGFPVYYAGEIFPAHFK